MIDRSGQVAASCNRANKMADKSETGFELKNTILIKRSQSTTEISNYQEVRTKNKHKTTTLNQEREIVGLRRAIVKSSPRKN